MLRVRDGVPQQGFKIHLSKFAQQEYMSREVGEMRRKTKTNMFCVEFHGISLLTDPYFYF